PVPRRLQAGDRDRVAAALRQAQVGAARLCRAGRPGTGQGHGDAGAAHAAHGPPAPKRTLTEVPFWISTFAPLFWITVLMPAALPKAPPVTTLPAPRVPTAVLPSTVPSLLASTTVSSNDWPPRID